MAATISLPIFACVQAVGPWDYYGFEPPIAALGGKEAMLLTLKTDSVFVIDVTNRDGTDQRSRRSMSYSRFWRAAALWPLRALRWRVVIWASR